MQRAGDRLFLCFACLVCLFYLYVSAAWAMDIQFNSDTIVRAFERETAEGKDTVVNPFYEYMQFDMGALDTAGYSLHAYGWGRSDLSGSDYYDKTSDAELLYCYLKYKNNLGDIQLGRQQVVEGTVNESVDGLHINGNLPFNFKMSAFAGLPVSLEDENGAGGDHIWGGRFSHHYDGRYEIGVSYQQIDNDGFEENEDLGVDTFCYLPLGISLSGLSTLNMISKNWAEHDYALNFPLFGFNFRPYYQKYSYKDVFGRYANSANPFRYLASTEEVLTVSGSEILYQQFDHWDIGTNFKQYDFELREETASYISGLLTWHGNDRTQVGAEVGTMNGDSTANMYKLARGYFYLDYISLLSLDLFFSGDVVYTLYDQAIYNKDDAVFASLAIGGRFLEDALDIKLAGDYSADPFFDKDFRVMLTLTYRYKK